ncbi:MAG TPA: metallopeptidase family protein [Candidatus Methylacidiphilales bacterium]|nr:metallopeptidase family protein [Candidatus Methylacidiphilales bacterium]
MAAAQKVVERTMAELPPEIAAESRQVPVLFEEECVDDPEILGHYGNFEPGEVSDANGPIILYLGAIEAFCAEEGEDFAEEVRITYLHELGHHLGLDEGDLEERGLE